MSLSRKAALQAETNASLANQAAVSKTQAALREAAAAEERIEPAFSDKCPAQVNQVSITDPFNMKCMERKECPRVLSGGERRARQAQGSTILHLVVAAGSQEGSRLPGCTDQW